MKVLAGKVCPQSIGQCMWVIFEGKPYVFLKDVGNLLQRRCVFVKDVGNVLERRCVFVKDVESIRKLKVFLISS